ncbi:MAG: ABC transporter permease [Desulfarculaceae bacterium]|jgi:peptide/nickel transport system permease protein
MLAFLIRRFMQSGVVLLAMSVLVFVGVYAIGDPVSLLINPRATQAEIDLAIHNLGLDRPLWEQYVFFLRDALQGDLGDSFIHNVPALKLILNRLPATLELVSLAMLMAVCIGIPLGMWAGLKTESIHSRTIMAGSIFGFSLPSFWVGMMLVVVFSITLGWLPTSGRGETVNVLGVGLSFLTLDGLRHLILPVINLSLFPMSLVIRLTRAGMQETLPLDFVKLARAKGLTTRRVILVHVLKNILIPIVTVIGINFGGLLAFAVVTETVFAWPGMGKLIIDSINLLDRPVVVAYLLLTVLMFTIINLVVDILYSVLDPRVRLGDQKQ